MRSHDHCHVPLREPHIQRVIRHTAGRRSDRIPALNQRRYNDELEYHPERADDDDGNLPKWGSPQVQVALAHLSDEDRYVLESYYVRHRRQCDIASDLGMTQPGVCHRLMAAGWRLRWWAHRPQDPKPEDMRRYFNTDRQVSVLLEFAKDCCQLRTVDRLRRRGVPVTQGYISQVIHLAPVALHGTPWEAWARHMVDGIYVTPIRGRNHRRGCRYVNKRAPARRRAPQVRTANMGGVDRYGKLRKH